MWIMYNMIITSENKNTYYMLKKKERKWKKREGSAKANPNEFWAMSDSAINNNIYCIFTMFGVGAKNAPNATNHV